ncbi:MAG: AP2 domain-containing protein [Acidobacteria bacterium]|nr:AP2 domain-containing protein [Acidobacteriota bacterium]
MKSKHRLKSISRIDTDDTHGWYVRVRFHGKEHRKFFSDSKYGNKLSALVAAKKYRDEIEVELGKPRTDRMVMTWHKANSTGFLGVRRREFPAFEVQASIRPGKIKKVIVPIIDGDEEAAFKKACEIRVQLLKKSYSSEGQVDF